MTNALNAVKVEGIYKSFGSAEVLRGLDIEIHPGELVCLLGPSGCGKTTLLRTIAGLETPDRGRISLNGRLVVDREDGVFVRPENRGLGMVFQHYALWPQMTVLQNISYPLKQRRVDRAARYRRAAAAAEKVGLGNLLDRHPNQLSGGQQQRVALARAVVHEPDVLLLDEPLSNLDATLRQQLRRELRRLHERLGSTMVHVTHDQDEAASIADTVIVLDEGSVVQQGTPTEILQAPNSRFVAEFVGFDLFLTGEALETQGDASLVQVDDVGTIRTVSHESVPRGAAVEVAIRTSDLTLGPSASTSATHTALEGVVERVSPIGSNADIEVRCGSHRLEVRVQPDQGPWPRVGEQVCVGVDPARTLLVAVRPERTSLVA